MPVHVATFVVWIFYTYVVAGLVLLPWWHWTGLPRLDSVTAKAPWGFRVLVSPGLIALWPFLLPRAIKGAGRPPVERNAHRSAVEEVSS